MPLRKRLFAWFYHRMLSDHGDPSRDDPLTRDVRAPLLAQARGAVLELGAGDGANLPLYPADARVTLLDINPYLLRHAPDIAGRAGCTVCGYVVADGHTLPFPARTFDTVVATHVLCSVGDQARVLADVRHVLRPDGVFLFMEHVVAPSGSSAYRLQRVINPVWRTVGDGCTLTRDTGAAIRAAGFGRVELDAFQADYPVFVSSHIVGRAYQP